MIFYHILKFIDIYITINTIIIISLIQIRIILALFKKIVDIFQGIFQFHIYKIVVIYIYSNYNFQK